MPPEPDGRDYNARLDETYNEFEKAAMKYNPDGASDLLSSANDMACENACVYLEIGIQAGFLLIADMMKNIQGECQGYQDDEDSFHAHVMAKDIMRALDILKNGDGDIHKACRILERWGKPGAEPQGEEGD